jgi:predicted TIM-barrel fold metal-dependent hydrolase
MAIPVIDAHHHIWRQRDLPWLNGPIAPRIFGDYTAIRRDYEIDEFIADAGPEGVVKSVYVQANWAAERAADEAAYVHRAAETSGWPHGFVGYADLMADDAGPALDRLAAFPLTRGIRMQLHWHEQALYRYAARPDLMNQANFRNNLARLADHGWSFELQIFQSQMPDAARLAADFPALTFILQHCGMPHDDSEAGRAGWREGMAMLAARPNVVVKLSGLGTFINRNDPDHIARVTRETVALFGPERCLYGSNFPIEKLWTGYKPLIDAFRKALADWSEADRRSMFHDTAARVYRLDD